MNPFLYSTQRMLLIGLLCIVYSFTYAQTKGKDYKPLVCVYQFNEMQVQPGQAITNILQVFNVNGITREFYLEVTVPEGWRNLTNTKKVYRLDPNDSLYIPVRLVPNYEKMKGGTKYNINVFVVGTDGRAHAMCTFMAFKPKLVDWGMSILPQSKIYFLNNQFTAPLSVFLQNRGDDAQQVNLNWSIFGNGLDLHYDTLKTSTYLDFSLLPKSDTIIDFKARIRLATRNTRRVNTETYSPLNNFERRKYTVYFRATDPFMRGGRNNQLSASAQLMKLNSSVDFIKLSDQFTMSKYGTSVIPLTWHMNLFNVLGSQPIMMNQFNAMVPMPKEAMLYGSMQHFFTTYTPSRQSYQNLAGSIYYNRSDLSFGVGQVNGFLETLISGSSGLNFNGNGLTIKKSVLSNRAALSGYYIQDPILGSVNQRRYGAAISFRRLPFLETALGAQRTESLVGGFTLANLVGGFKLSFLKGHKIFGRYTQSFLNTATSANTVSFINTSFSYMGSFFRGRLNQSLGLNYFQNQFFSNLTLLPSTLNLFSRTQLNSNRLLLNFTSSYIRQFIQLNTSGLTQVLSLPFQVSLKFKNKPYIPIINLFYTNTSVGQLRWNQVGTNLNYFKTQWNNNTNYGVNALLGYNFLNDTIPTETSFFAQVFLTGQYHTFRGNIRYMYGFNNWNQARNYFINPTRFPQYIFTSLNRQFAFANNRIVLEAMVNHSWNNITYSHNFAITPNVYFFTLNGWRFNAGFFYNMTARNAEKSFQFYQLQNPSTNIPEPEQGTQFSSNFNLTFGLRKEIGIPIPKRFRKTFFTDATFVAFLDFNGNHIKDPDEVPLENLVIQVNGHEAITNKKGEVTFFNVAQKKYFHNVIPLVDVGSWFTMKKDSIDITEQQTYYVPFTKGVMVEGAVLIDREKFTEAVLAELDMSRIRVFTTDTMGNAYSTLTDRKGNFSFYVPYGFYTLSMDEEVLSDRFFLAQNNIPIELEEGMESYYQAFFVIEKRRRVRKKKFNEKGEVVYTDEVAGDEGSRYQGPSIDSTQKDEGRIFNDERRNGGKKDSTDKNRLNYDELDKRIDRLDSIMNQMRLRPQNSNATTQQLIMQAMKELKKQEENATPFYVVQVAVVKSGASPPRSLEEKITGGSIKPVDDGNGNTVYYWGEKYTDASKALDAVSFAAKKKIGKPEIRVLYQEKVMTLKEFKDAKK